MIGWQRVKVLVKSGRWIKGAALGAGTATILLSLLAILAMFVFTGDKLHWIALMCAAILGPGALASGIVVWRRAKMLAGYRRWIMGAALGMGVAVTLLLLFSVALLAMERLLT